ncbi:reverse transcriptase [Caerostris extrusa]|uniref:Reverse transcriptase n=1 Tax=Caerostris extrusa TaxID=172846 RepID=A0AAV4RVS5_CAEEX|nr:reverse transcriptase [Caerostris extrusa]
MTADVKMIHSPIRIDPRKHGIQRFLWNDNANESPKTYGLEDSYIYSFVIAPYLAMKILKQLSVGEESSFHRDSPIFRENICIDGILCGGSTLEEIKRFDAST